MIRPPRLALAALLAGLLGPLPAAAQLAPEVRPQAEPDVAVTRHRGTVVSADGDTLTIQAPGGGTQTFAMHPRTRVYAVTPAALRDIKPESYVSVLGSPGPEPRRAGAVTLYSPSERGFEAGDRPWDTAPGASMTGGWITGLDRGSKPDAALRVALAYEGGRAAFAVPAGTPVTQIAPGEKAMLQPGAAVTVFAQPRADGPPEAGAVAAGRRGAVPGL